MFHEQIGHRSVSGTMATGSCGELYGTLNTTVEAVFYVIIMAVIILVASVLNITIIVLIKTRPTLHQPSFILLAALACSDLAMVCIPGVFYLGVSLKGMSNDGAMEVATCFLTSSITVNNVLLLCCITYDRYQCIKHSQQNKPHTSKAKVAVKITVCIFASFAYSSIVYIETNYKIPFTTLELLFIVMFGCFFFITVYYIKLSRVVRASQVNSLIVGAKDSNGNSMRRAPSYQSNLNKSILLLIASYVLAYFPASVVSSIRNQSYKAHFPRREGTATAMVWSMMFSFSNSVMDPLIYTFRSDAIGRELRRVCLSHLNSTQFNSIQLSSNIFIFQDAHILI